VTSAAKLALHSRVAVRSRQNGGVDRGGVDGLSLRGGGERRRRRAASLGECVVVQEYESKSRCGDLNRAEVCRLVAWHRCDVLRPHQPAIGLKDPTEGLEETCSVNMYSKNGAEHTWPAHVKLPFCDTEAASRYLRPCQPPISVVHGPKILT
jgi:hypothetical protein